MKLRTAIAVAPHTSRKWQAACQEVVSPFGGISRLERVQFVNRPDLLPRPANTVDNRFVGLFTKFFVLFLVYSVSITLGSFLKYVAKSRA
jgi:hypothetical protein